jgi:hypothetical protein
MNPIAALSRALSPGHQAHVWKIDRDIKAQQAAIAAMLQRQQQLRQSHLV